MNAPVFTTFSDWHHAITERCGLTLDRDYCEARIAALQNEADPATRSFLDAYGPAYRDQVVAWFRQALHHA